MRYHLEWSTPAGALAVIEPSIEEVVPLVDRLVAAYNEPVNARLLGHTVELAGEDVLDHYRALAEGGRAFLLYRDGELAGDGDLRGVGDGVAEFAFLIADPAAQGRGLGTRFAIMIHALAFGLLGLERVYASVIPENVGSRRVFEKLGYAVDEGARERGDEGDVVLSIEREVFWRVHGAAAGEVRIRSRGA